MSCKMEPILVKGLGVQPLTSFEICFHAGQAKSAGWEVVGDPIKTNLCVGIH